MSRNLLVIVLTLVTETGAGAGVFSYECDVLPARGGWDLLGSFCDPEESVVFGWLVQHMEPECEPEGDQVTYGRTLGEFVDEARFFIDWRMQTNGSSDEFLAVAPASLVAGGANGAVLYHFTIARDQVRFIRESPTPIFIDIDPDVPHTYRLELFGRELYVWYIDGEVADTGVPAGAIPVYPGDRISFRAMSWLLESTTKWDYIRYGTIPADGSGDFDGDADIDIEDFYFFRECLTNSGPTVNAGPGCRWADMDQDTDVDANDFALFQRAFTGE